MHLAEPCNRLKDLGHFQTSSQAQDTVIITVPTVCVGASIGHAENSRARVLQLEVLVLKLGACTAPVRLKGSALLEQTGHTSPQELSVAADTLYIGEVVNLLSVCGSICSPEIPKAGVSHHRCSPLLCHSRQ